MGGGANFYSSNGEFLNKITASVKMVPVDFEWMPDNKSILVGERYGNLLKENYTREPTLLCFYNMETGKREEVMKVDYFIIDLAVSRDGKIVFSGWSIGEKKLSSLYEVNLQTKEVTPIKKPGYSRYHCVDFMPDGKRVVFRKTISFFGNLIWSSVLGVMNTETGFSRYFDFYPGVPVQLEVVGEKGQYVIIQEGTTTSRLYKKSTLGGFRLPFVKSVKSLHLKQRYQKEWSDDMGASWAP